MSIKDKMKEAELAAEEILNPEVDEEEKMIQAAGEAAEKNPHFNPKGELMEKVHEIEEAADELLVHKK